MPKIFLLLLAMIWGFTAGAQYPGYKLQPDPRSFKEQFTRATAQMNTIQSDFVQEKNMSLLSEKLVSKGKFWFKKENLVRMEYQQPFQYLMVINNNNIYIRDGQKENKVSAGSNKLFQQINRMMVDCVRGTVLNNPDFSIRVFEGSQHDLLELTPQTRVLKEIFKTILLTVDKNDFSVSSIEMNEPGGDNTLIHFTNKVLNLPIPDAVFAIH